MGAMAKVPLHVIETPASRLRVFGQHPNIATQDEVHLLPRHLLLTVRTVCASRQKPYRIILINLPNRGIGMFKITGIEKLSRDLEDAQKAMSEMDGKLGSVSFDPHDPASIEAAIREVEGLLDERLGSCASNPIVGPVAAAMKEQYRQGIIDRAAAARTGEDDASEK